MDAVPTVGMRQWLLTGVHDCKENNDHCSSVVMQFFNDVINVDTASDPMCID